MLAFVGCSSSNEFEPICEGAECEDDKDAGATPDASHDAADPDAGDSNPPDAGEPDSDAGPDCSSFDADAHPADEPCVINDGRAIFVSPTGNDATGNGSRSAPYASIGKGLAVAKAASRRLYVCDNGTGFDEHVVVNDDLAGLEAFGGFSCSDWSYDKARKAKVLPSTAGIVFRFDNVESGFRLEDFHIEAPDAAEAGTSSIAVLANESEGVVFERVRIKAGKGAAGAAGADAPSDAPTAGERGWDGRCLVDADHAGGAGGRGSCGLVDTQGGAGGAIKAKDAKDGEHGQPEAPGSGRGGQRSLGLNGACVAGGKGTGGAAGEGGASATGLGSLSADGWVGASGEAGKPGTPGQGGGGGGAGLSCSVSLDPEVTGYPSGGGGGAGGCGGKEGGAGGAGGSSIAVVSLESKLSLNDCELMTSDAGNGGDGGKGQPGGAGGQPGVGKQGPSFFPSHGSCAGGEGGRGGDGGNGGAGAGGHSVLIAFTGSDEQKPTRTGGKNTLGNPGQGGAGATDAEKGESGTGAVELHFP